MPYGTIEIHLLVAHSENIQTTRSTEFPLFGPLRLSKSLPFFCIILCKSLFKNRSLEYENEH